MDTNFTTLSQRIDAFHKLGRFISSELLAYKSGKKSFSELFDGILFKAYLKNNWFTEENQIKALEGILQFLDRELLNEWLSKYESVPHSASAKVAVIMAGNIPMVGFHDFLSVLMAGHRIIIKLSSDDKVLLPYFAQKLTDIDSAFSSLIHFEEEKLSGFDAVIATGSNNSARYFEYYFSAVPHIIRKNRNSVAIITGNETEQELKLLAEDIFTYFGLGCRNVSKIYIPEGYDVNILYKAFFEWKDLIHHHKYANNYNYNRTIYLMSQDDFYDNGFLLIRKHKDIYSPIATLNYEHYSDKESVKQIIEERKEEIQCIAASPDFDFPNQTPFGATQSPALTDYADGIDTLQFLTELKTENV